MRDDRVQPSATRMHVFKYFAHAVVFVVRRQVITSVLKMLIAVTVPVSDEVVGCALCPVRDANVLAHQIYCRQSQARVRV